MESSSRSMPDRDGSSIQIEVAAVSKSNLLARRVRDDRSVTSQRLGVGDLLLWVTFVSIYFGVVRARQPDASVGSLGLVLLLSQAAIAGVSWSGLWLVLLRWARGVSGALTPGHWLLFVLGGRIAIEVLLGFKPGQVFSRPDAVVSAAMCCLLVVPTLDQKLAMPWRVLIALFVLACGWPLLQTCLSVWFEFSLPGSTYLSALARWMLWTLSPLGPLVLSICYALRGTSYRGLHWVGVTTWIAWHVLQPALLDRFLR